MVVTILLIKLRAPWVHSLKEKRSEVQSLIQKTRSRFNASIIEADLQDVHQEFVLGIAYASGSNQIADSMMEQVVSFIEENTDAEVLEVSQEKV